MYRAVIVDDEPFMLEGMRLMIDWQGCGFTLCGEAGSAQEALRILDTQRPHLLITDVCMPGMQGTDLAAIVSHYHPETMLLFFSGHKDFHYAQAAIRSHAFAYLMKPIDPDEVHETLRRARVALDARGRKAQEGTTLLRDQVLRRIALGDESPESLMRASVLLNIQRGDPCYCAVLSGAPLSDRARLLLDGCGATPFALSASQYGLSFRQLDRDLLRLERLAASLSADGPVTLSVGEVCRGAEGFGKSLREALDAQGLLFALQGSLRLYRPLDSETAAWLSRAGLHSLRNIVLDGDCEALESALVELRRQAPANDLFPLRCLAAMLSSTLPCLGSTPERSESRVLWQEEAQPLAAWFDALADWLRAVQSSVCRAQQETMPLPVATALNAVHTRFPEQLTLGLVAQEQQMNPAYLGQLIRRHTGVTFHRHLTDVRLEHACVLLRQTVRPVGDIALDSGFRDVDYFSQQFRSRMGMSPLAYRGAGAAGEAHHEAH